MLPWSVDEIHWEHLHSQTPLDPTDHYLKPLTVPDQEAWVIQLIGHLFEIQIGVLRRASIVKLRSGLLTNV